VKIKWDLRTISEENENKNDFLRKFGSNISFLKDFNDSLIVLDEGKNLIFSNKKAEKMCNN